MASPKQQVTQFIKGVAKSAQQGSAVGQVRPRSSYGEMAGNPNAGDGQQMQARSPRPRQSYGEWKEAFLADPLDDTPMGPVPGRTEGGRGGMIGYASGGGPAAGHLTRMIPGRATNPDGASGFGAMGPIKQAESRQLNEEARGLGSLYGSGSPGMLGWSSPGPQQPQQSAGPWNIGGAARPVGRGYLQSALAMLRRG